MSEDNQAGKKKKILTSTLIVIIAFIVTWLIYASLNVIEVDPQSADGGESARQYMKQ